VEIAQEQKAINPDFLICCNNNPGILAFNLSKLRHNYPNSTVYLYDWGFRKQYLDEFRKANSRLRIIRWRRANVTSFMYNKVLCIKDYYDRGCKNKLVYIDNDVVVQKNFDEVFSGEWDIGAIWRPEYSECFGTEQWLNGGTIFFNDLNLDNVAKFVELWKQKCDKWQNKAWWLCQVELINLFKEVSLDFRDEFGVTDILCSDNYKIRLKTFNWYNYNFYPGARGFKRIDTDKEIKIIHFKSPKRKQLFEALPVTLIKIWLLSFGKPIFERLCNLFLSGILNVVKLKNLLGRRYLARKYDTDSEIYYWKVTAIQKKPLCDFAYFRANEILKIFFELNGFQRIDYGEKVIDVGPGPCGQVLDLLDTQEKWLVEPRLDEYRVNKLWISEVEDLTVRTTAIECMEDVPEMYFDSVFAINSIDRGHDVRLCIDNICKILKNGGHLYLNVHCRTPEQTNKLYVQSFTGDELIAMLAESGFEIEHYRLFDEDPLSGKYNTFIGICRKR
jgi:SAM-dependent methyltransferase